MKISDSRGFVNQAFAGLVLMIGFGGTIGLGTVWMRHQVSVLADNNRVLQQQIDETERRIASTTALVEEAQSSDVLRSENESMHLGLVEMTQTQVIPVAEDPVRRLAARANERIFESERGNDLVGIHINIEPAPTALTNAAASVARPASAPATPTARNHTTGAVSRTPPKLQFAFSE